MVVHITSTISLATYTIDSFTPAVQETFKGTVASSAGVSSDAVTIVSIGNTQKQDVGIDVETEIRVEGANVTVASASANLAASLLSTAIAGPEFAENLNTAMSDAGHSVPNLQPGDTAATAPVLECERCDMDCGDTCADDDMPTSCTELQTFLDGCASDCTAVDLASIGYQVPFDIATCTDLTYGGSGSSASLGGMSVVTAACLLSYFM